MVRSCVTTHIKVSGKTIMGMRLRNFHGFSLKLRSAQRAICSIYYTITRVLHNKIICEHFFNPMASLAAVDRGRHG